MKRQFTLSFVALLAAGLLGFLFGSRSQLSRNVELISGVQAQSQIERPARGRECTAALLQGAFAFSAEGTITAVPPGSPFSPGPYATVGVINFDGQGNLSLSNAQSYNGAIVPPTNIAGAYVIGNDCTGRVTLNTGAVFNVVAADAGREVHFIQINTGAAIRGIAKKN